MSRNSVLLGLGLEELETWALSQGQSAYRGRQIYDWLYNRGVRNLDSITVLPKALRTSWKNKGICIGRLEEVKRFISADQTLKILLSTKDGQYIETVGIPTKKRLTVCVSSQVGCPMKCQFCATGKDGLQRSLYSHEIIDQVISISEAMGKRPTHIVFMGMGEPLLNCQEVLSSIKCFNNDLGISQRRITVSTVGVRQNLSRLAHLANEKLGRAQFTLAVSLHASNQQLREKLIPTATTYPINDLLSDCKEYIKKTGRRVTFEYILLGGVNDHIHNAEELAKLLKGFQSHVNLIAYNPIKEESFERPTNDRINSFRSHLENLGVAVSFRKSRGLDQNAACGQLRRNYENSD